MGHPLLRRCASDEGVVTILVALMLGVLLGVTAMVVDLGRTRIARQQLQDAVDSGSLAAAAYLPVRGPSQADAIKSLAARITTASTNGVAPAAIATTFWCVLRVPPNTPGGPSPDLGTATGFACGPSTPGAWSSATGWATRGGKMSHACSPYAGDLCNAVKVQSSRTIRYLFAPAIGVSSGSTGNVQSFACQGPCKPTGAPLDVVVVLDRTQSMTSTDITNVRTAATALLKSYDPTQQQLALMMLPHGRTDLSPPNPCQTNKAEIYPDTTYSAWLATPLSSGYKNADGTLNSSDPLVAAVNCYAGTAVGSGTNIGDPMAAAADYLNANGRAGVPKVVIVLSDGEANQPSGMQPCTYAVTKAETAKRDGVTVFTVGYGVEGARCGASDGSYSNAYATKMFATMATSSVDDQPGGCAASENSDGDNYFCNARDTELTSTFKQVALETIKHARLIDVE